MVLTLQKFSQRNGSQKKYWGVALRQNKLYLIMIWLFIFFEKQLRYAIG